MAILVVIQRSFIPLFLRVYIATIALSCRENPLWIAKIMGHRNTNMSIKVYSRYVENAIGPKDGSNFDKLYQVKVSNNEEK
ncbi:MAG: hypothetical protein ACUVQ9_01325 [Thermodesulfobacteriota bacterium]